VNLRLLAASVACLAASVMPNQAAAAPMPSEGWDDLARLDGALHSRSSVRPTVDAAASDTFPDALEAARTGYVAAWNGSDGAALAAYFAEDAQVVFPDYTLTGRAQIEERWLADDVGKVSGLVMTPGRIARDGDEVTEAGSVTLRFRRGDGEVGQETGRYEHVWKLQADGIWKLQVVRMDTHPAAP